jgi:hypothetical protein
MSGEKKPWAFIAHKDGEWIGLQSAMVRDAESERTLGRWIADGLTITTTYSREEFDAEYAKLTPYRERGPIP